MNVYIYIYIISVITDLINLICSKFDTSDRKMRHIFGFGLRFGIPQTQAT